MTELTCSAELAQLVPAVTWVRLSRWPSWSAARDLHDLEQRLDEPAAEHDPEDQRQQRGRAEDDQDRPTGSSSIVA